MQPYQIEADDVLTTLQKYILVDGFHIVIDLQKSHGNYIVDARTGKEYLDMYAYFATLAVGHNHPKLVGDEEFQKALKWATIANPTNSDIYCKEYAYAVDKLAQYAMPEGFKYMFFIAGGALAIENALKASFDWKIQKNYANGYKEERGTQILHFKQAFHGRTGYTMSLTNTDPVKIDRYPKFNWPRIINPKLRFPITNEVLSEVIKTEEQAYEQIRQAFKDNKDDIAAIIIEPIQGEGGDNHFRAEFFKELRKFADEYDAMFIVDEVQTGGGATGKLWAYAHYGISPDVIAFGKKLQVCGIIVNSRIDEVENNVFKVSSRLNSTWGGNLADMLRGVKYLEIIREDNLIENARVVGDYLLKKLEELADETGAISNVRGKGLFIAFDLADKETRDKVRQECFDAGLATLTSGEKAIRFRPALTLTKDDSDKAIEILAKVIKKS